MDQTIDPPEVIAIAGVEIESVRVCCCGDEQVSEAPPGLTPFADDGGYD